MGLQIRRLSYALGAEIIGLDLRKPLDDQSFREVHAAFLEHSILLFRGQPLTRGQHVEFSRRFGEVDTNDAITSTEKRVAEYPEILLNTADPGKPSDPLTYRGRYWHTDQPHTLIPPAISLLLGIAVPETGGDTMFSNMYLAYESLSDGMKKLIEGIHAVHAGGATRRIANATPERAAQTKRLYTVAQPLVKVHPETGRKALYLTETIKQLVGMTAEESQPLIRFLCEHATRPQFVYRHQWQEHDLLMWDNRCLMHHALGDYDKAQVRHMERTTVRGTPSGYLYDGPLQ